MRSDLGQPLSSLGLLLLLATAGFLVSTTSLGRLLPRSGFRPALAVAMLLYATALFMIGFGPWLLVLAGSVLFGIAVGVVDGGINLYSTLRMSGGAMQFLHGTWGIGTLCGPLLVTGLLLARLSWRLTFLTVGGLELVLAAVVLLGAAWPAIPAAARAAGPRIHLSTPLVLGVLAFFVYTGIESTAGAWSFVLLTQGRGFGAVAAGLLVSAYWSAITAGRMAGGVAGLRVSPRTLLFTGSAFTLGAALLLWLGPGQLSSLVALPLLGLGLAPVYPALMTLTATRLPSGRVAAAVGYQTAAAGLGASTLSAGAGLLMQYHGVGLLAPALAGGSLLLAGLVLYQPPRGRG